MIGRQINPETVAKNQTVYKKTETKAMKRVARHTTYSIEQFAFFSRGSKPTVFFYIEIVSPIKLIPVHAGKVTFLGAIGKFSMPATI